MMTATDSAVYYDPYDLEIDTNPYPMWKRLHDEQSLYEVLQRFPSWEVDWDNAVQARTSTMRGWERLPVLTA